MKEDKYEWLPPFIGGVIVGAIMGYDLCDFLLADNFDFSNPYVIASKEKPSSVCFDVKNSGELDGDYCLRKK